MFDTEEYLNEVNKWMMSNKNWLYLNNKTQILNWRISLSDPNWRAE